MSPRKRRKKSVLLRLLVLGVSVYMIFTLTSLWNTLADNQKTLKDLEAEYAKNQSDIDELKTLLDEGSREEIIEKAARERLGFVYSDEEIYIDISGN